MGKVAVTGTLRSPEPLPPITGDRVILRTPQMGDHAAWAALRETSVIFAAIFSAVILKEHFHPRRYLAIAMVALGAVLLH